MLTPYAYAHSDDNGDVPGTGNPNYLDYTNAGQNIGPSIQPDSLRLEVNALLRPDSSLDLNPFARMILHGNAGASYGGTGTIFDYGYGISPEPYYTFHFLDQSVIEKTFQARVRLDSVPRHADREAAAVSQLHLRIRPERRAERGDDSAQQLSRRRREVHVLTGGAWQSSSSSRRRSETWKTSRSAPFASSGSLNALACEDTRHTRILFEAHGITSPRIILSYREKNESQAESRIIGLLKEGLSVGICSDAGYPGDQRRRLPAHLPGSRRGVRYRGNPRGRGRGAGADLLRAPHLQLHLQGLSAAKTRACGARFLTQDKDQPHTLVFYESPFRVAALLRDALEVYGDRRAAVCIELTKKFERIHRGTLSELLARFKDSHDQGRGHRGRRGQSPEVHRTGRPRTMFD